VLGISKKKYPRPAQGMSGEWKRLLGRIHAAEKPLRIGVIGKYFTTGGFVLSDAYISVIEALKHASWAQGRKPELVWIDAERLERSRSVAAVLGGLDGIVVPGGFGKRGIEGKLKAIRYAREQKIPYLGLCYGMQLMVVEYARNVARITRAHTTEIEAKTPHPVIDILPEQKELLLEKKLGASMRLGAWKCRLEPKTLAAEAYGGTARRGRVVSERHRHRYEVNSDYVPRLEKAGLVVSGINPERELVEVVELPKKTHPFFLGTQFHPELQSTPLLPHPLFMAFITAARGPRRRS
jgi:CTP synthase